MTEFEKGVIIQTARAIVEKLCLSDDQYYVVIEVLRNNIGYIVESLEEYSGVIDAKTNE